MNKYSSIKKIDENTFQITEYDTRCYNFGIKIKYSYIFCIIIAVIICIVITNIYRSYGHNLQSTDCSNNISNELEEISMVPEDNYPFSDDGFVFPNSSNCYLAEENLRELYDRAEKTGYSYSLLLRHSVNEIYARNGYRFKNQELDEFYSKYQWYNDLSKVVEVSWKKMNNYEQKNLTLLLNEEQK